MDAMEESAENIAAEDEVSDVVQCRDHPYRTRNPGGICALCLQERLGKLVSSSLPLHVRFPSTSSSPPLKPGNNVIGLSLGSSINARLGSSMPFAGHCQNDTGKKTNRLMFLFKKKMLSFSVEDEKDGMKRSRSVAASHRSGRRNLKGSAQSVVEETKSRKGANGFWVFWSFLYFSPNSVRNKRANGGCAACDSTGNITASRNASPTVNSRVSRSRSAGCGSGKFSGELLERISLGLGECAVRRSESLRESSHGGCDSNINVRKGIRCSRMFGGVLSSFSISSSSSSHNVDDTVHAASTADVGARKHGGNGRSRSWGFPSPVRAFKSLLPAYTKK